jgi:hypothetical protein
MYSSIAFFAKKVPYQLALFQELVALFLWEFLWIIPNPKPFTPLVNKPPPEN